jgi:diguanylate cyclase (GGDEF)-like protein
MPGCEQTQSGETAVPTDARVAPELIATALPMLDSLLLHAPSLESLCAGVLDALMALPGVVACWIWQPGVGGRLVAEACRGVGSAAYLQETEVRLDAGPLGNGVAGRAWRSGEVTVTADWQADASMAAWHRAAVAYGWRAGAVVPLRGRNGQVHRLICLYSDTPGLFAAAPWTVLLAHLRTLLGLAVERAERGPEERARQARLARMQQLYRAMLSGGEVLLKASSETMLLQGLCQRLVESRLFQTVWIGQPDAATEWLTPLAGAGPGLDVTRRLACPMRDGPGSVALLAPLAWRTGRVQFSNDLLGDPRYAVIHDALRRSHLLAAAVAPIRRGGERWALLIVIASQPGLFDREVLHLLARLAGLAGRGLDERDLKEMLQRERAGQSWIARHDPLTGLPNRLALTERLPAAIAEVQQSEGLLAVGMLDLDDFKPVNDRHGHAAGDTLLRILGQRLRGQLREGDLIARLGGDEFALVLGGMAQVADLAAIAERLRAAIEAPVELPDGTVMVLRASLGFTLYPLDDATPEGLLRHADTALYAAKERKASKQGHWELYRPAQERGATALVLRRLIERGGVRVQYQPILDLRSGAVVGVEALARLAQGEGLLSPAAFLPHLSPDDRRALGRTVLGEGLRDLAAWAARGWPLGLSVNVDPAALLADDWAAEVHGALARAGIAPERLTLELLESGEFLSMARAQERMAALRASGIRIALDDVGSAYSSLLRLKALRVDRIKLDHGFVSGVAARPDDLLFVASVQSLARGLRTRLVVEGAETPDILDALRVLGVEEAQGYAIARPMPAAALAAWLDRRRPEPTSARPSTLLGTYASYIATRQVLERLPRSAWCAHATSFTALAAMARSPTLTEAGACLDAALDAWCAAGDSDDAGREWEPAADAYGAAFAQTITARADGGG